MSATPPPAPIVSPRGGETAEQRAALGAALHDLFMPQYVPRPVVKGYTPVLPVGAGDDVAHPTLEQQRREKKEAAAAAGKEETSDPADESVGESVVVNGTSADLVERIAAQQATALHSLRTANGRLRAFGAESDRLMPSSSTALFQHVQLVAAVRKELETLELRVGRCLERAERIKAFDEAKEAAALSTASTYGGSAASSSAAAGAAGTAQGASSEASAAASCSSPTTATAPTAAPEAAEEPAVAAETKEEAPAQEEAPVAVAAEEAPMSSASGALPAAEWSKKQHEPEAAPAEEDASAAVE